MPSLKLADAWKDFTPPSPPEVSGKKEGGNTVHTDSGRSTAPATDSKTVFKAAPSPAAGSSLSGEAPFSADSRSSFFLSPATEGVLEPGNIDLRRRPVVRNRDGSVSMARSFSVAKDGREYLIPTVSDEGRLLSDQEAIARFEKTGRHLGAFRTAQDAVEYADKLDREQEILYAANPEDFKGVEVQKGSLVSEFPRQAATPLSPTRPRSIFDRPLTPPLIPSSTQKAAPDWQPDPQRIEELHALILHYKNDPELDALLERNPAYRAQATLDDGSMPSRAALGEQIMREVLGEKRAGEPGFYFLATGEKLPEAATRQEAYAAVYDHYAQAAEKQYEDNKARRAAYQKNRAEVEQAVSHVVGGVWSPADLNGKLTPEQMSVYRQEFDTDAIEKAHTAFSLLKEAFSDTPEAGLRHMVSERTAMKITSALSEDDGTGKLTINETAFGLFEGSLHSLMEAVKEQSGDEWKFMHNMRVALFNPVTKRDASLGTGLQLSGQQQLLVPFAKDHNAQVFGLMEQTVRDYEAYVKNDHENARVLGILSTGQDLGNQANDRASFASRTVNCLGSIVGQTAPFFIPYVGWGLALAGAYDDKRNRAYYDGLQPGTAEWSAFVDAAASVAVEKISYGGLGRLSWANRVMGKLPFMAKTRAALTDSLWKKILFESGAGVVEETLVEPTAEAIIQWAVRNNIAPLVGINAGKQYDWSKYWKELKNMLEPDQLLATALFVGGVAGTQSVIAQRSLITHSRSPEMLRMQGLPEDEANRISRIEDNKERIAAVREAVNKLKTLPPEEVLKNAKEGVQAFRSLAEVRATVESEAYKFFQQEMRLPLVEERADKPGTYQVTVFDSYSGQKKFSQEMTEGQLVSLFGNYFSEEQRKDISKAQSAFAANAFLRKAEEKNIVQAQDMLQWGTGTQKNAEENGTGRPDTQPTPEKDNSPAPSVTPAEEQKNKTQTPAVSQQETQEQKSVSSPLEDVSVLGRFIRTFGAMNRQGFSYLIRAAMNEWDRRLASGMSRAEAAATPFEQLSPYAPLGYLTGLEQEFKKRMEIASQTTGEEGFNQTLLFQMGTAPGTTPADFLFLVSRGLVGSREMLEDLFEVGIKRFLKGDAARLQTLGSLLRDTQAGLQKLGFQVDFIAAEGPLDEMRVMEAMSKLALSDTLVNAATLPLPQWQKDLLQYHVNYLQDAAYLLDLGHAYNLGREKGVITQDIADILRDLGHQVHTIFDRAKIEQQDIRAVMEARAIVGSWETPGGSSGAPTASQIREKQQQDAEEEEKHVSSGDTSKERTVPQETLRQPGAISLPEAPESMKGVFVNGAAWNPDAGTWLGMVPVDKLNLSPEIPQVKVNSSKKGIVNPLVGDYRADAPPIYVWKRKKGRLEVVSGRHRLDLAQRTGIKAIPAYVYEEDFTHNAQWARLLDYEQNMQDDQADELTAAIYVRETSLTDDELTRRGLTRSGTKSRRGLLIGREAREDLWTRFRSGAIKAQDAEAICLLTQHIQNKDRIDAMQMTAANDLAGGKTLEFVAAKIQLMAHASADGQMVQGLISFGESFEEDMERAAEYVSRCIGTINEHINAIRGIRTISKKGSVLATEGITAGLSADPAERLRELELLKAMYEKIGLYENLRVRALTWDGHTPPDPIGDHRLDMQAERARAAEQAAALEEEENRKASEALTPTLSFSLSPSPAPLSYFPALWKQASQELNAKGHATFSLNGDRIALHTLSEIKMRRALELGGMPNPAVQVASLDSGPTHYGEIACILYPDRIDPARTPGARIWRGDAWTRQMPEKISEDGDPWEGYEHGPEEKPRFRDEEGDLREWTPENLDAYMQAKHRYSFLPHDMPPDDVLENYGTDGAAFPIILAAQAYGAEFSSLEQAMRTDNLTFQLDRRQAAVAVLELEKQFKSLLNSCYFDPYELHLFLMKYRRHDTSLDAVRQTLDQQGLLEDPNTIYDQEEEPEEYADLQASNAAIVQEVKDFLDACRTSAKIYYEAAPGGWLFPSDFSGFILPSSLESTLRPELEKYGVPIHIYNLTEEEALALATPWTLAKSSWLQEEVDERRNEAIHDFLEDHDVSFSLSGEEEDLPASTLPLHAPTAEFPLGLRPVRVAESFHAVEQSTPLTLDHPSETLADREQGFSKLARTAYKALRGKTRSDSLPVHPLRRREELAKPILRTSDGRPLYLSKQGWSRFLSLGPDSRSLGAMALLEPLIASARYMHSVPAWEAVFPAQIKAWHYYMGKIHDDVHDTSYVLLTLREEPRGCYLEALETVEEKVLDKNGSASSLTDFGLTHHAAGRSLPAHTLLDISRFVNFIDQRKTDAFRAPNGQPTLLSPDQWHLVRTSPFLHYFGDWLHDPASASVILDANGEPLVCYRGLRKSYNSGVRRHYTWVSTNRELSEQYADGGTVLDLFVSTRRLFRFPHSLALLSPEQFRETVRHRLEADQGLGFFPKDKFQKASQKLATLFQGSKETEAYKIFQRSSGLKDLLASLGYDAVEAEEDGTITYGLFYPGQAKSASGNYGAYDITLPDISFALSPEESLIAARAREDGTWLKAPNGEPSRLKPKLWTTVRTRTFREWFGDWERDPLHASRVVDDNGEPLVVYHGSLSSDFTTFHSRTNPALTGTPQNSYFFSDSRKVSATYSNNRRTEALPPFDSPRGAIYSCFLNIRRLHTEDFEGDPWHGYGRPKFSMRDTAGKEISPPGGGRHWKSEEDIRQYADAHRLFDYEIRDEQGKITTNDIVLQAQQWGSDGVLIRNVVDRGAYPGAPISANTYAVFHPEQIKSAYWNRGAFDTLSPDITFSLSESDEEQATRAADSPRSSFTAEEQAIIARAMENEDHMLAPNGSPTLLTEKQWAQVRTKAFREWFGDWLHNPASASRVVDENGEPLVLYHGTRYAGFTIFDNRLGNPSSDTPAGSTFFAVAPDIAADYGSRQEPLLRGTASQQTPIPGLYPCFLNLRSPLEEDFEGNWWDNMGEPWFELYDKTTGTTIDPPDGGEYWTAEQSARNYATTHGITNHLLIRTSSSRTTHTVVQEAIDTGHDGAIIRNVIDPADNDDRETDVYVAIRPEQIKSATQNRGTYDASAPDITFALSNLASIHSLDAEKLLAADKLGGLPLPSLAVTRLDKPYTWGGEDNIYLIGSPALADPERGVEIHDRDAWSGHFPQLRWNVREEKEREVFYRQAQQAALRYCGDTDIAPLRFLKNALEGDHRGALENKLRHNDLSLALFAGDRGYTPRPLMTKTLGRLNTGDKPFYQEIRKMRSQKDDRFILPDRQQDFCAAMERVIARYRESSAEIATRKPHLRTLKQEELNRREQELQEARGDNFHNIAFLALQDARLAGKTVPDWHANYRRFEKYAAAHPKAFNDWVADKMARWLHPTPRIKANNLPATLNNLVQYMLGSKRTASERGLVFSTGLLRASQSRRFTTLDEIKENRDILVTTEEHKASQETGQNLIHAFQASLNRIIDHFNTYDNAVEALSFVRGTPTRQKVLSGLGRFYAGTPHMRRIENNSYLLELGVEALNALKTELRDYFEAVPQRAVLLSEFTHAILPATLKNNKEIRDALRRNGIRPRYHDGTLEGRLRLLSSMADTASSFSLTPGPSWLKAPGSRFMASLTDEERVIAEQALASRTWLQTPGGQPTRLTPRQWLQVRTQAFRDWFGDWFHDPTSASRAVDENGEPLILYHGTPHAGFAVFNNEEDIPLDIQGRHFFTDKISVAATYARTYDEPDLSRPHPPGPLDTPPGLYPCYLNLRTPLETDFKDNPWEGLEKPRFMLHDLETGKYIPPSGREEYWQTEQAVRKHAEKHRLTHYSIIPLSTDSLVNAAQALQRDGVIIRNVIDMAKDAPYSTPSDVYAVFHSAQIKSATQNRGTYDPLNPDITFSVIGPRAATWEQYKGKTFTGRDDGRFRAEIDASQARFKDHTAPYRNALQRELAALRKSLPAETKKQIARYLALHRQFYNNKKTLTPEKNVAKWKEYLSLNWEKENWKPLLADAFLRAGLCHGSQSFASYLATISIPLLVREDTEKIALITARGLEETALPLEDRLDYPELFAAYPQLRNMFVIPDSLPGFFGLYSHAEQAIYLNRDQNEGQKIRSILLHEIQHAIQHIEGLARGGQPDTAKAFYEAKKRAAQTAYDQSAKFMDWLNARDGMISTLEYMLSLARNPRRVLRTGYLYSYDGISLRLEGEERILDIVRYALTDLSGQLEQYYDKYWNGNPAFDLPWPGNYALSTPSGIRQCLEDARATPSRRMAYRRTPKPDMKALYRDTLKYERLSRLSPYELYRRLAGEMEAYAVESRRDMTAQQRAGEPFNNSLEYPPEEALVTFSLTPVDSLRISRILHPSPSFLSTLTEEERTLAERTREDGTWLLAPTGQPSRLTPRQWLQVRTAAFKSWFGDWQHDPLAASLAVDDNGEPLVLYHGSRHAGFTVFDAEQADKWRLFGTPEGCYFFTDRAAVAHSYANTLNEPDLNVPGSQAGVDSPPGLYPCFLNTRNSLETDFGGAFWDGTTADGEPADVDAPTTNTIALKASEEGYDAAIIRNVIDVGDNAPTFLPSTIFAVFHSEQIKSATQNRGAFDPRNPDITFSLAASLAVQQSITSADTSRPQIARTFKTVRDRFGGWKAGSSNIDIGGGKYDAFTQALEKEGVKNYVYDPFGRQASHNRPVLENLRNGTLKGDTVTCSNVLNVIPELAARNNVIHQVAKSLKPEGTAWFCIYEGDGSGQGRITKTRAGLAACWQENRKTAFYLEEIRPFFGEVEMKHGLIRARFPRHTESPASWRVGGDSPGIVTFSLSSLREQGLFTRGVLPVQNALVTSPGSSFSLTAEHASPYSFQRFSTSRRTKGVGALSYGWGLYFTASPLRALRYEQEFQAQKQRTPVYFVDGQEAYPSGADEEDILDELATNGWKSLNSYLEENRGNEEFYATFHPLMEQYRGKTVERRFVTPPTSSVTTYRVELNVDEADLLPWEEPVPPPMREKILSALRRDYPQIAANLTHNISESEAGDTFYDALAHELDKEQASKWLLAQDIKGIRFDNFNTGEGAPYDYVIFDENDIKITAVRDASTHWQTFIPYHAPSDSFSVIGSHTATSFSLSSLKEIVSSLAAPSMQATRAAELIKDFDQAAENWKRIMSGKEDRPSARVGAELFGTIDSLISAARHVLPRRYHSRVHLQMQWASVYAAMAESGEIPPKGTLQSGDIFYKRFEESVINNTMTASTPEEVRQTIATLGARRLDRTMSRILDRVRDQLIYFTKDELLEKTMKRVEVAYPKKERGKKSPRGKMEAQAYRTLARYRLMLASSAATKEEAMTALEKKYREEEDEDKQQEHEKELLAWKTFGDYKGMSLQQAQNAMQKLLEFTLSGRNAWDSKLQQERGRTKYAARTIQRNLPTVNSATSRATAKIEHRTRLKKFLATLPYSFMSYSHLMLALEPILGQRFSRERIREITEANAALLNASNDRSAWLSRTIRRITGVKSESAAEQWLVRFNKPQETNITMAPVITVKVALPVAEARDWLALTKEERDARRKEIREKDDSTESLTENVPEEMDIVLLRMALDEYDSLSPEKQQYRNTITSEREIDNEEGATKLICSRDCALYAILLHEQPDYADVYDDEGNLIRKGFLRREGLNDAGIDALYDFVGQDGLEYGYALRRRLQETGLTLAQVYEERMGVPFTLKENYFRATFDRNSTREKDALTEPKTGGIGGGKYGLFIDRILHSENLDFSKSGTLVFLAAAAEQDNYIYTSHITTAWRALLKNKVLEQKLRQNIGEDLLGKLTAWMDLIDGASLENNRAFLNLSRMQGMLQRAFAISVLAGNGYVVLKQSTAILHGFFAGWIPSTILDRAAGTRELSHKHISFSSYLFHLASSKLGLGDISLREVAETPYFMARMRGEGAMLAQIGNQMPGQRYSRMEKPAEKSMDVIEVVDVKANLLAMHALANAYYARARALNKEEGAPFTDEQLRKAALEQVGMSLELGAQPLTKTQRSMNQAAGGILSRLAFVMKSEQLNKIGLMASLWKTGSARNRVSAVQAWLSLGVTSSLLAWLIDWIKGLDEDDDKKKWKKYGATALAGDLTTIPLAGEGVNYLLSLFTGNRVFADSYARSLVDVGSITRAAKKEYEHLAGEKEMNWDTHFNNLTSLVRAAGVGGAFSRSSSAVVSGYGALSLSAATGANISRTTKDLLTTFFRDQEEEKKKQKPEKKRKSKSDKDKKRN